MIKQILFEHQKKKRERFPRLLSIELSSVCNAACIMCPHSEMERVKKNMTLEMVEKIAEDCVGKPLKKINLFWFGDSLCHKKVIDAIRIIRHKLPNVKLYFSTNAGLLWKDRSQMIIDEKLLDVINFDIDGITKETFENIRIKLKFDEVMENVHYFLDYQKQQKASKPQTRITIIKMEPTVSEIEEFKKYWTPLVDKVDVQEIPNPSFEDWSEGYPVDWWGIAILQVADSHDGDYAVSMQILDGGVDSVIVPILAVGDFGIGTDVSQRYSNFGGYYKFAPNGNEWFNVAVVMMHNEATIGSGFAQFSATIPSTWRAFNVQITYTTEDTPDRALIAMNVSNGDGSGVVGSYAIVDNVMFADPTSIEQISELSKEFSLKQNYPNPFNPSTKISFSLPSQEHVVVEVFNMLGQKVITLMDKNMNAGYHELEFNGSDLSSGVYFYAIQAGQFNDVKKMIIIK